MSTTLPPIGARIRTTTKHDGGATVVIEGIVTAHPKPPVEEDRWVIVGDGEGVTAYTEDWPGATVTVEILSGPEPADGSWVTVPTEIEGRQPYVFSRNDEASPYDEYRWWFHEDGDWVAWTDVEKRGEVTVIKDGAA